MVISEPSLSASSQKVVNVINHCEDQQCHRMHQKTGTSGQRVGSGSLSPANMDLLFVLQILLGLQGGTVLLHG